MRSNHANPPSTGDRAQIAVGGRAKVKMRLQWVQHFQQHGIEGLQDQSRRPKHCRPPKVLEQHQQWIVSLRKRRLGSRRIQSERLLHYNFSRSPSTIHKVLKGLGQKPLQASRRLRKGKKRYQKEVPGERVQVDGCKIAPSLYTELASVRDTRATQFLQTPLLATEAESKSLAPTPTRKPITP